MTPHGQLDHEASSRCPECVREKREHRAQVAKLRHQLMLKRTGEQR